MSVVTEGISFTEMKPSKYKFFKKCGNDFIFVNKEGQKEVWRKLKFSEPGFVLKFQNNLFKFHSKIEE